MNKKLRAVLSVLLSLMCLLSFVSCESEDAKDVSSATDISESASENTSSEADVSETVSEDSNELYDENGKYIPVNYDTMKIMKLTQWDMSEGILLQGSFPKPLESFRETADKVMKNIKEGGFNTVLLQVRPFADSFYKSKYYPLSYFVTGDYSRQQDLAYDPVSIFVEKAHKYGLSVHGWFNPMRAMTRNEIEKIKGDFDILKWYNSMGSGDEYTEYMFVETDAGGTTRLYLNIAYSEVRELIINGVEEMIENYNFDGVFMDDYFYPSGVRNNTNIDSIAYENRTDDSASVFEFRCNAVNTFVKELYSRIKLYDERLIYGISPNGDIDYAYQTECADIYTWCKTKGYVDVMYPQFYYGMLHKRCSIDTLTEKWNKVIKESSIKLVPVLTLHKAGVEDQWAVTPLGKSEWQDHNDVLLSELVYLMTQDVKELHGLGFFCYSYFYNVKSTAAPMDEIDNMSFLWQKFEEYNGKTLTDLKELFTANGYSLDDLLEEWSERIIEARFAEPFENCRK